jgi:membrane protein
MIKETVVEWLDDDAMTWAAAVACYTLLALAPVLVLALKVLTVVLHKREAMEQLRSQLVNWMGPATANAINEIMDKTSRTGGSAFSTIISLVLIVISIGGVFAELQHAMNRIWKVKPKPGRALWGFVRARLLSLFVLVAAVILMLVSVPVTGWIEHLTGTLGAGARWVTWIVDVHVSIGVLTLLFALLYRTVPDAWIEWRPTVVGAIITAVLFEIGRYGLAMYFRYAAPASAFGAVGSLAAVLIWIYYSFMIVFFGAEFTQVYAKARGYGVRPSKHAESLKECDETETATPSSAEPGEKPQRPGERRGRDPGGFSYGDVLSPYVARRATPVRASGQSRTMTFVVGALGLASGTLIGAFAAARAGFFQSPSRDDLQSIALRRRLRRAEHKVARASRIRRFIELDDRDQRIEALERQIRGFQTSSSQPFFTRLVRAVRSRL